MPSVYKTQVFANRYRWLSAATAKNVRDTERVISIATSATSL